MDQTQPEKHSRKRSDDRKPDDRPSRDGNAEIQPEEENAVVTLESYDALQKEVEEYKARAAENFEGWARERADFLNYRKRVERDQVSAGNQIKGDIMKNYLQILDDLELALKSKPEQGDGKKWAEGIELISRKLRSVLETEGIKQIVVDNGLFDPNVHEAISYEPDPNFESGEIIEVVQNGYKFGDRVLRPAKVRVAR